MGMMVWAEVQPTLPHPSMSWVLKGKAHAIHRPQTWRRQRRIRKLCTHAPHTNALHTHASHTRLRTRTLRIRQTPHTLRPSDGQHTALSHLTHVHLSPAPCFPPSHIQHVYLKANTHLFSTRATHTHHRTPSYTHVSHGLCGELRTRMLRRPLKI
jgi:hypothetical protein